jgi:hypothetical protein
MVKSQIIKANGEPVNVDYMMRRNGDTWLISDIYLDGAISEVATRRSEFIPTVALDVFPLRTLDAYQIAERGITRARRTAHRVKQFCVDAAVPRHRRIGGPRRDQKVRIHFPPAENLVRT